MARRVHWKKVAAVLAAAVPLRSLHPEVVAWAASAPRRQPWTVAFSGGADSLAVLLLMWAHWPERRRALRVAHFDHRLRGRQSTADAAFCRKVARALGLEVVTGKWMRPGASGQPSEAEARAARLTFLHANGRVVWFGHNQDDVAETLLMRVARGAGAGGLSAPRPVQPFGPRHVHLRPLLTLRRAQVRALLASAGAVWREDETNPRPDYFRNRIRSTVIPAWEKAAARDAVGGAAWTRQLLSEDDAALEAWANRLRATNARGDLVLSRLRGAPRAVVRRCLHRWILALHVRIDVSRQAFDFLLDAVLTGRRTRCSMGPDLFAVLDGRCVRLQLRKPSGKFQRPVN